MEKTREIDKAARYFLKAGIDLLSCKIVSIGSHKDDLVTVTFIIPFDLYKRIFDVIKRIERGMKS